MSNLTYEQRSQLLLEETIDALRNKPFTSTYLEKLQLTEQASRLYCELPQPLFLGNIMTYMLEHCSCPVEPHDILVGRFPECVPNEEEEAWLQELFPHFRGEGPLFGLCDWGHTTFDWEEILRIGISGYVSKAEQELQRRSATGDDPDRIVFLQGMELIYRSYRRYMERYVEACKQAGMEKEAAVCRNLTENPPATFLEAMQLILFITNIYSIYSAHSNATLTCGRMDELLAPYYERDLAAGILTREEAGCIIDDFNCKCAIILGRGEHQMSGDGDWWFRNPMYDSPTYVIIGGYSHTRDYKENPLTALFLERIHPRLENPVYVYRRTKDCPANEWRIACDKLRQNSTLLIYNDEIVVPAMKEAGIQEQDAMDYTIHGCNWPDVAGLSCNVCEIGGPIPKAVRAGIFDIHGWPRKDFLSMDEIYEQLAQDWRATVKERYAKFRSQQTAVPAPSKKLSCSCCFHRGTLEAAATWRDAVPYRIILNLLRHIGTAADMMAAIEELVFGEDPLVRAERPNWTKIKSMEQLAQALNANFVGYEDVLKRCRRAPKYGRDDDAADKHAVRLMKLFSDIAHEEAVNPETGERDIYVLGVTIADSNHIYVGRQLPATPDGRLAGEPISENLSPTKGTAESVTALINSVTKIDFSRCVSGTMNLRMPKSLVAGDEGLEHLMILLETYFENGGMQVQLSVADTAELRDAQLHPENYKDLMVRITGYSAVFVDMAPHAQEEIIRRDILS